MNKSLAVFMTYFLAVLLFGQNSIDNIYIEPANPTSLDSIKVYSDLTFHSSGCGLESKYFSIGGNTISASAHHCLGMAMAICNTIDTFMIGTLSDGTYTFNLTLTSGFGNIPCTPGIAIDDNKTFNFTVGNVVGLSQEKKVVNLHYANGGDIVNVLLPKTACYRVCLYDLNGKCIQKFEVSNDRFQVDMSALVKGIYIMQVKSAHSNYTRRLLLK